MIKKFLTQEATLESLKTQIADAQARLDTLTDERAAAKRELDELKYAGVTGAGGRQEVDVVERKLAEANGAVEKAKTRYERLAKALVDLRAGVEHLNAKLETASRGREEEEEEAAAAPAAAAEAGAGAPAGAEGAGAPAASDDAVLAVLGACQSKLLRLMRDVEAPADGAAAPAAAAPFARGAVRADSAPDDAATRAAGSAFLEELLDENNVRVSFSKLDTQDDDDDDDDEVRARRARLAVHAPAPLAVARAQPRRTPRCWLRPAAGRRRCRRPRCARPRDDEEAPRGAAREGEQQGAQLRSPAHAPRRDTGPAARASGTVRHSRHTRARRPRCAGQAATETGWRHAAGGRRGLVTGGGRCQ